MKTTIMTKKTGITRGLVAGTRQKLGGRFSTLATPSPTKQRMRSSEKDW